MKKKPATLNFPQLVEECNKLLVSMGEKEIGKDFLSNPLVNTAVMRIVFRDIKKDVANFVSNGGKLIK